VIADADGVEWVRPAEAARRLDIERSTIDVWVSRGRIRKVRAGRHVALCWPDVLEAERAWRERSARRAQAVRDSRMPPL